MPDSADDFPVSAWVSLPLEPVESAFDKAAPERAFGRLGPLSKTYPNEPSVRFHLGVLLLWTGRIQGAERQFRLASKAQPGSALAREADRYLETISRARG